MLAYRAYNEILRKFGSMVPCLHQSNAYIKKKLLIWRVQKYNFLVGAKTLPTNTGLQTTPFHAALWKLTMEFCRNSGLPIAMVLFCTKAMLISKGSYGYGEPKNVIALSVQKTYWSIRACKLAAFMQRQIGPTMEIWGNSGLPITMVPCLHQSNVHTKR